MENRPKRVRRRRNKKKRRPERNHNERSEADVNAAHWIAQQIVYLDPDEESYTLTKPVQGNVCLFEFFEQGTRVAQSRATAWEILDALTDLDERRS